MAQSGGPGVGWEYLRTPELERFLTMVYVEPIGTGDSARLEPDDEGYSLDRHVHFLHAIIARVDAPVHLLGHSHGGFVAQRYGIRHPDRVASLVSYSSSPRWDAEVSGDAGKQLALMAERLPQRQEMSAIIAASNSGFEPTDESFTAFFRTILPAFFADYWIDEERLRPLRGSIRAWVTPGGLTPFDDRGLLRDLRTPTLIVVEDYDFICGPQWGEEARTVMPSSQLVNFRCGHMAHLEKADLFCKAVAEFVTSFGN